MRYEKEIGQHLAKVARQLVEAEDKTSHIPAHTSNKRKKNVRAKGSKS